MRWLVDTSVWIAHLRSPVVELIELLSSDHVLAHSVVIGEMSCGSFKNRREFLGNLKLLDRGKEIQVNEVLTLIEMHKLYGKGLGWSDCQILASALISDCGLLTYDKMLRVTAQHCGIQVM